MTKGQGNWESIRTIDFTLSGDTMLITNQQDTENAIGISYTTRANGFKKPQPLVIGRKIVSVAVHPNGELYYVKRKTGELIRFDMQTKEEKVLYLTFDDGPDTVYTNKLLDLLDQEQVPATFFMVAEAAQGLSGYCETDRKKVDIR